MKYMTVSEIAQLWGISQRSVRNYCAQGRVPGAKLDGKTWLIPESSIRPERKRQDAQDRSMLLKTLKREKSSQIPGGIYHKIQIDLTYNSNRIEGSKLTHDQTRYIFETNTIGLTESTENVDDIVETANHFRCFDMAIDAANHSLSSAFIKWLHFALKNGTSDSRKEWFAVGQYKKLPNEVGGMKTTLPEDVATEMDALLASYSAIQSVGFDDVLDFHHQFESIHPFQDGNGRVGRLILFKECLRHRIVPFIIADEAKMFYYRGLKEWPSERGYLRDTCLAAQDEFKESLDYFRVEY